MTYNNDYSGTILAQWSFNLFRKLSIFKISRFQQHITHFKNVEEHEQLPIQWICLLINEPHNKHSITREWLFQGRSTMKNLQKTHHMIIYIDRRSNLCNIPYFNTLPKNRVDQKILSLWKLLLSLFLSSKRNTYVFCTFMMGMTNQRLNCD